MKNSQGQMVTVIDALNGVITYKYDAFGDSLGNITSKTGVGTYTYGSATVRPHAVTGITGTVNGVVNPTYTYDANGNQTVGAGRTLTYTSFNLPKTVTMASISQSYAYDAEHQRIVMTEGSANTTTYINPRWDTGTHFEKEKKGTIDEYKHYIYAGGKPVALYVVKRDNGTGTNSTYTRYLHTDHLGSVEVITSETGAVVERLSYDAWGKRRNANGTDATVQLTSNVTHQGYTGHEMNDSIGLINMNGRWYDPTLGRFMQADPSIDGMANLQGYNRYSYVANNPLSMTDPSGYKKFWKQKWFKKAVVTIAVVALAAYTGGLAYNAAYWAMAAQTSSFTAMAAVAGAAAGAASGAIVGAASGYAATGTLKGAIEGAAIGGATGALAGAIGGGLGNGTLGRMMNGGLNGAMQTGSVEGFARGMLAGAVPTDLGMRDAYMNNGWANAGIGVLRDGIRGYMIDGEDGARRNMQAGLVNNSVGHLFGYVMQKGWGAPTFSGGAFSYNVTSIPFAGKTPAIALGNVVSYNTGAGDPADLASIYGPHEQEHTGAQSALGVAYLPLQAVSQWGGSFFLERNPYKFVDPYP